MKTQGFRYALDAQRLYINKTQYFGPIPVEVYEYRIGGYQVCDKWLKDRKERRLELDDIRTYCRTVVTAFVGRNEAKKTALLKVLHKLHLAIDEPYRRQNLLFVLQREKSMSDQARCVICGTDAQTLPSYFDGIHQKCLRCGEFKLTGRAESLLQGLGAVVRANIPAGCTIRIGPTRFRQFQVMC